MPNSAEKVSHKSPDEASSKAWKAAMEYLQKERTDSKPSQTPIAVCRSGKAYNHQITEKRALKEAALALARLWNLSPGRVR
jgi:hypothetical protein